MTIVQLFTGDTNGVQRLAALQEAMLLRPDNFNTQDKRLTAVALLEMATWHFQDWNRNYSGKSLEFFKDDMLNDAFYHDFITGELVVAP